jgi:hypothetical protein
MMGQGQLVTTMSHQHTQQPMQQQQQQQVMVQTGMQPQLQQIQQPQQQLQQLHSQQLQLPAKQLWVQSDAAAGPSSSSGMVMQTQNSYQQQPQQYAQLQQQQQVTWPIQQVHAANGHYAQANSVPQQQQQHQSWQTQVQQQHAPAPVQHFNSVAATAAMQHNQQQQQQQQLQPLQIATQLLAPALGQLQYQQQPHQQQQEQVHRQLSPVITLPSNHPANPANAVYRPSPRLSGDGCFSSFLLPRLSADGGFGGQWTPSAVAAAAPGAVSAFAAAAASAFKHSASQPGTVSLQQQQQGQSAWGQQLPQAQQQQQHVQQQPVPQQQQLGGVPYFQAANGKVSNNSGSSSSGEWHPAPHTGVQQSGALSGLIQGFAAEMQARAHQQQQLQQQQQEDAAQQYSTMQQDVSLVSASTAAAGYQSYEASAPQQAWLQQPGAAAPAAADCSAGIAMVAAAPTVAAPAGATTGITAAGADAAQELLRGLQLPEFAMRIAEEFKASLSALRHSMVYTDDLQQPGAQQEPGQAVRVGSSSGSTSPGNSSDGKGLLPGSCESVLHAGQQQQQQDTAADADAAVTADADAGAGSQGVERPADDSTAAGASPGEGAEQQAKRQKRSPAMTASVQLPPLGNGATARLADAASGSPPRPIGAGTSANGTPPRAPAAAGPFATAAGGAGYCQEGSAQVQAVAVQRAPSVTGLTRTCSAWSDTPPPPEASAALLELAAQMHKGAGGLPETADAAAQGAGSWQQQQAPEVSAAAAAALAAAAQQLLTLPVPGSDDQCGEQKHRALVAGLMKKATDDARACGLADPSLLVTQLMCILDDHVAALSQLGNPGTELGVASAGGLTVELPAAPSVGGDPDKAAVGASAEQCAHSAAAGVGFAAVAAAVAAVP